MEIALLEKSSLTDYPGKAAAVVYTATCNMNCRYCRNGAVFAGHRTLIDEDKIFMFLEQKRYILEALVISGGEPTIQPDLDRFIDRVKEMGYLIKLDTNGTEPDVIRRLIKTGRLDYVSLDVKGPFEKYPFITGIDADVEKIKKTLSLLTESSVQFEVRASFIPQLEPEDFGEIAREVKGVPHFCIQQYAGPDGLQPRIRDDYVRAAALVKRELGFCEVRGVLHDMTD